MTISNTKPGMQNTVDRAEALSTGTTKHFPDPTAKVAFGGGTHTIAEVNGNLGQVVTLRNEANDAEAQAQAKRAAERTALPNLLLFMAAYVAFLKATFGNSPDVLADFGLAPKKARTPLTVEQQVAAKAKRKATREARGTRGPVAKKEIVGNVVGVTVTPILAPTAPSAQPAAAPAPQPATAAAPITGVNGGAGGGTTPHA
ncbi:MAG: hypothetical protein ACRELB_22375 [Polyangiaceae bacterium]